MTTARAAAELARTLRQAGDVMSTRVERFERAATDGWSGRAYEAMILRARDLRSELDTTARLVDQACSALEGFAEVARDTQRQRIRSDDVMRDAAALTARWRVGLEPQEGDPGAWLRWRADQMRAEALAAERAAAQLAARSIQASADGIRARPLLDTAPILSPLDVLGGLGDILEEVVDTVGDGVEWGWDRATDLAGWTAEQAERIADGIVWVGDKAIDVGQSFAQRLVDEARATYAKARFPIDFALFHSFGDTPDGLPDISDEYRRSQNAWSYALIPVIEASGGECTELDNGIFACLSDGIELPGDLGTIPLKGRGGTTYGEVFIVDEQDAYERVQEPGSLLADHEKKHSIQWAIHGPAAFVVLYLQDVAMSGNNGADQYFEQQAGAAAGGYHD